VRLAALVLIALALPLGASAAGPLVVTFHATTHSPKVNTHWPWSITATSGAKKLAGTVTAQVVDPVGGIHAVDFGGSTTKSVTNIRFVGRFADFVIFPPISRGLSITFRVTVRTALGKKVVNFPVTAK
jgi:hypothetical protein